MEIILGCEGNYVIIQQNRNYIIMVHTITEGVTEIIIQCDWNYIVTLHHIMEIVMETTI